MKAAACATLISPSTKLCRVHGSACKIARAKASVYRQKQAACKHTETAALHCSLVKSLLCISADNTWQRPKRIKFAEHFLLDANGSCHKLTCLGQMDGFLLGLFGFWLVKRVA